jgi:ribonuclease G
LRELVIVEQGGRLDGFLLENRHLVEYYPVPRQAAYVLGDIFVGVVSRIAEGLNSAFVDIGLSKEGFLHYTDLGSTFLWKKAFLEHIRYGKPLPNWEELPAQPSRDRPIKELLKVGDWVLVQLEKDMVATKGPRLSSHLSLIGHLVILVPLSRELGVSTRITNPLARQRLREIIQSLYRPPYGLIVRSSAENASAEDIAAEYERLIQEWEGLTRQLTRQVPPFRLTSNNSPLQTLLREMLSPPVDAIYVESPVLYEELKAYFNQARTEAIPHLRLHRRRESLLEYFELDRIVPTLFSRTVTLPNGSYIVIEHTEALHVIDVNTGSIPTQGRSPEEALLQTNLLAAREIARQIRLRDLGGIIVVDFIDLRNPENRQRVWEQLVEAMRSDRAKHQVLPMSEFGLVQITRQRRRSPHTSSSTLPCPLCKGQGSLPYPEAPLHRLEESLHYYAATHTRKPLRLQIHPLHAAYWRSRYPARDAWIWGLLPHRWLLLDEDPSQTPFTAKLYTLDGHLIAEI